MSGILETELFVGAMVWRAEGTLFKVCVYFCVCVLKCKIQESVSAFNKLLMPLKDNHRWSSYNN